MSEYKHFGADDYSLQLLDNDYLDGNKYVKLH